MNERFSTHDLDHWLQFHPTHLQDLLLELRSLVFKVAPHATERVLWGGLSYHDASIGGPVKGAICQLSVEGEAVHIGFIHGAFLPDPAGLLQGARKSKRWMQVDTLEATPWSDLEALIAAAAAYVERWGQGC
jgi:hypothetical protein